METIKINKLEIENVKRVKAVKIEPTKDGLTIIGGNNNQGKTSVLDAIAWALGGNRLSPSEPQRKESVIPPYLKVTLSNGLVVERTGKNSTLKVIDPSGEKAGQQLLDSFIEELALNLPKFMNANNKEKANILLQIIGVSNQLAELELKENELYQERLAIGRIADQKDKFAQEQIYYPEAPKELISASELIKQQQDILARNGENQRKRDQLKLLESKKALLNDEISKLMQTIKTKQDELATIIGDLVTANKSVEQLQDESTEDLENSIRGIEEINRKVRANLNKDKAEEDALQYKNQYSELTQKIEKVRDAKTDLLKAADLPLPGLTVENGLLKFNGNEWDNMSGSEQLRVATAIVRKLNPKCGFVLLDKLEQMDLITLNEFGKWLESEGLQAIATRVSTGEECSVIIEDGYVKGQEDVIIQEPKTLIEETPLWKAGEF